MRLSRYNRARLLDLGGRAGFEPALGRAQLSFWRDAGKKLSLQDGIARLASAVRSFVFS